ncbi:Hypothetical protein SRAE_2000268500 [Strongyloides ratti]|uniref:Uncharacterized protein n=1 Tax=Strongyloides ratti TaxID=34506 RepID=A0A090MYZ1_STRRB|nr:Hypothetical protein SRAE_2000268500 [Strongyloides ratti]CEF68024.1 Hypothetical protein SRAE_2000268500 [Strongyloides ratti]
MEEKVDGLPKSDDKEITKEPGETLLEKGKHLKDDILGMFKKGHGDYPVSEPYKGKLEETKPSSELSGVPLDQHVEAIPSGHYDKLIKKDVPLKTVDVEETKEPGESLIEKGKHLKDEILGMFIKGHSDYPVSEPYIGKLEETKPSTELSGVPLDQHVEAIPSGYYDKLIEKDVPLKTVEVEEKREPSESLLEKGKHLKDEILGVFKKDYSDYPVSEPYLGEIDNINKQSDLDQQPIDSQVSKYHVGYYGTIEKPKEETKVIQKEPSDSGDKKGRFAKITSIFSGKSIDYPVDSEPYSGKLEETKPSSELSGAPLEQHVEAIPTGYYEKLVEKDEPLKTVDVKEIKEPGESLLEKGKHLKDDILGMFKKDYADYPVSEPFTGKLEETKPSSELSGVPLQQHVEAIPSGYYDKLIEKDEPLKTVEVEEKREPGESLLEKGKHLKDEILGVFKKDYSDYPVSAPYFGKLEETKPSSELSGVPLDQHVETIPTGYYDKLIKKDDILKTVDVEEIKEPGESLLEKGKHLKDEILGVFKKDYSDYPVSEPYLGTIHNIKKQSDLDQQPIDSQVYKYHVGYYGTLEKPKEDTKLIQKEPSDAGDKKGRFPKITSIFSGKSFDYPMDSEPYKGKLEETKLTSELSDVPLEQHVEAIPSGYYDKLIEKDVPLKTVDVKEIKEPGESLLEKGKHLKDEILGVFKKDYSDYPVSEPYLGTIDNIKKQSDLDQQPIDSQVSKYHVGYYGTIEKPKKETKIIEKEPSDSGDKKGRFAKITSIFSGKSVDYPVDLKPFKGKLEETKPSSELSGIPLDQHVEVIPSGYYDKLIEKDELLKTVKVEEIKEPQESLLEKGKHLKDDFLGMFKKSHGDYPVSEPYTGKLDESKPSSELSNVPLDQHVEAIPSGYYDKLIENDELLKTVDVKEIKEPVESFLEKGKHFKDEILGVFKRDYSDYPVSEPYIGKVEETKPTSELTGVPLQQHVEKIPTVYYEKLVIQEIVDGLPKNDDKEETKELGETLLEKGKHLKDEILGVFKKDYKDYPMSEPYIGELDKTKPSSELRGSPLQQYVEKIPTGYYDKIITNDEKVEIVNEGKMKEILLDKGKHLKDELLGVFKKDYSDYPVSEPYVGVIDYIGKDNDLDQVPLDSQVSKYHVGYYGTIEKPKELIDTNDKKERLVKIMNIVSDKTIDYPIDQKPYMGKLEETKPLSDLVGIPLEQHIEKIPSGFYDKIKKDEQLKTVQTEETKESFLDKGKHLKEDIFGLFKKDHLEYPVSEPYIGKIEESKPSLEFCGFPIEEYVENIPTGYYDKLSKNEKDKSTKTVNSGEVREPKESLLSKGKHLKKDILGIFKKNYRDYPMDSEPYIGKLEETKPSKELSGDSLHSYIDNIPFGYYDKLIKHEPSATSDTAEIKELKESLLDKGKHLKDEILGVFKKDYIDYPVSEPYLGTIDNINKHHDLDQEPIDSHVSKYHVGYYGTIEKPKEETKVIQKEPSDSGDKKGRFAKITSIFSGKSVDYPVDSEPYKGKLEETKPSSELSGVPLEQHVETIPSGYYDKLIEKDEPFNTLDVKEIKEPKESLLEKGRHFKDDILGMFKKDHRDYPVSEPYIGKVEENKPSFELSSVPLDQHVEKIPFGFYDKLIEKDEILKTVDVEEKREPGESLLEKGKHLKDDILGVFKKDYSDYPVSEPYLGTIDNINKHQDLDQQPIDSHVSKYHVGYYTIIEKQKEETKEFQNEPSDSGDKKGRFAKITSIFSGKSADYPVDSEPYSGKLEEIKPSYELFASPLDQHVETIPSGCYDKLIEKDEFLKAVDVVDINVESDLDKEKYMKEDISGVFKKNYSNVPISEPYFGTIDNINKQYDLDQEPLDSYVSKYHVGYYTVVDRPKEETKIIEKEFYDSEDKKGRFAKITNIFSGKSHDYPYDSEPYIGKLEESKFARELSNVPLKHCIEKIPSGFYDKLPEKSEKIKLIDERKLKDQKESFLDKGKHLKDDIIGMFKKDYKEYPTSEPYTGKLEEMKLSSELFEVPLEQIVEKIPTEYSSVVTKDINLSTNILDSTKDKEMESLLHSPTSNYNYNANDLSNKYLSDSTLLRNDGNDYNYKDDLSPQKYVQSSNYSETVLPKEALEHHVESKSKDLRSDLVDIHDTSSYLYSSKIDDTELISKNIDNRFETLDDGNAIKSNINLKSNIKISSPTVKDFNESHIIKKTINAKKEQPSVYLTTPIFESKLNDKEKQKPKEKLRDLSGSITKSPQPISRDTFSPLRPKPVDNIMKITDSFAPYQNLHKSIINEKNIDLVGDNKPENMKYSNNSYKKGRSVSSPSKRHVEFTSTYSDSVPLSKSSNYDFSGNNSDYLSKSKSSNIIIDPKSFKITSENNLSINNDPSKVGSEYISYNTHSSPTTSILKNYSDIQYNYLLPTTIEYSNLHNNLHPSRSLSPSFEVYLRKYDAKMKNRELISSKPLATSTPIRSSLNIKNYKLPSNDNTSFKQFVETYDRESSENKRRRHKGWTTITETTTITYSKRLDSTINRYGQNQKTVTENVVISNFNPPYNNNKHISSVDSGKAIHDHVAESPLQTFERDGNKRDIMLQTDPNYKGPLNHPINYSRLYHRSRSESRPHYYTLNNTLNYNRNGRSTERHPETVSFTPDNQQIKRRFEYEQAVRNAPIELSGTSGYKTRASTEPLYSMQRIQRYDLDFPSTIPPPNSLHYQNSGLIEHDKSLNNLYLDLPPIEEIGKTSFEQRYSFTTDVPNDNDVKIENKDTRTSNAPFRRARTNVKHYCNVI